MQMRRHTVQTLQKSGRDFLVAFIAFSALFTAMTINQGIAGPAAIIAGAGLLEAGQGIQALESRQLGFYPFIGAREIAGAGLSGPTLAALLAALLFSSIVAFKLAFFRHLRRVHASSRRGAWRGN